MQVSTLKIKEKLKLTKIRPMVSCVLLRLCISQIRPAEIVERYRFVIAICLSFGIVIGLTVMLVVVNKIRPEGERRLLELEKRLVVLESSQKKEEIAVDPATLLTQNSTAEEKEEPLPATSALGVATPSQQVKETPTRSKIDLNTAGVSELDGLPGIGKTYAQRIIDYRNQNGPFQSIDQIKKVKGIGEKTFEKLKDQIMIGR
ncbi:MAG TPA: helix-hairpin-helix domain-containing protein [bacterium]|nr:helix-hairpin-helix domain-containing protein [bacterium]